MTSSVPDILKFLNDSNNYMIDENFDTPQRAKKRRLDHLSWEEKMQRKKLKNRVAAQTSRDRKKAKMEQMEQAFQEIFAKNEAVLSECEKLRLTNERLSKENAELSQRLQAPCPNCCQNRSVVCEAKSGSAESLLRPQGMTTYTAAVLGTSNRIQDKAALLKMVLICLLYQTCSTNSNGTSTFSRWNNSLKRSSKISPEIWRVLLKQQLVKNRMIVTKIFQKKWWGRHQNNWNPVEAKC